MCRCVSSIGSCVILPGLSLVRIPIYTYYYHVSYIVAEWLVSCDAISQSVVVTFFTETQVFVGKRLHTQSLQWVSAT